MRPIQKLLAALAVSGMLLPGPLRAVEPARTEGGHEPVARDVTLDDQGAFRVRVMSPDGHPLADQPSTLRWQGRELLTSPTSPDGELRFNGLAGGCYTLQVAHELTHVRLWTADAAPPSAVSELLVVRGSDVQRAQQPFCNMFGQEPIMIGLLIAAAIAIPIAVHNSGSDAPPGS